MGNFPLFAEEVIPNECALRPPIGCALHCIGSANVLSEAAIYRASKALAIVSIWRR
jgi:hypothetical protein